VHRPLCTIQILQVSLPSYPRVCSLSSLCFFYQAGCKCCVSDNAPHAVYASGQSCGKAWKSVVQVKHANQRVRMPSCQVQTMWKMDVRRVLCGRHMPTRNQRYSYGLLRDASHVVPVPNNRLSSNHERWTNHRRTSIDLDKPQDIVVPDTTDLFFNYFPAPPSFNPKKMLENINLAEELSRPVIPSDVHSGSLDPDPLPQDSKEHHFQTIKTSKKHSL
jgi:hypothetical protein